MADKDSIVIPARVKDLTGQVFGRLTVLRYAGNNKQHSAMWECVCECGSHLTVWGCDMRRGQSLSCGCLKADLARERFTIHGMSTTTEYASWDSMLKRCLDTSHDHYYLYGGRGITVCERWMQFENFFVDMGTKPSSTHTIDRIDNDGNYEPGNCRWATKKEQARNRRNSRVVQFNGQTMCVADWSDVTGIPAYALHRRFIAGWTAERALTTAITHRHKTTPS